jgi:exopolyphosphatase / guanosine-5'-triphosphate,3'-diphosphate pyrophosphatase
MATKVAVVDVGSNTVRLVVAIADDAGVSATHTERVRLGLGRDLERHGRISRAKVAATAEVVGKLCARARAQGAHSLDVVVTAPGRQAENGAELAAAVQRAAGTRVRVLSADEEARLAFAGAVAASGACEGLVAVVDLGGGSTEIAVGDPEIGPSWVRSVDLGALRLTEAHLGEGRRDVEAARAAVAEAFAGLVAPIPRVALVVGGSARALQRVVGPSLGSPELTAGSALLARCPADEVASRYGVGKRRATLLLAASLILEEVQRRLFVPLEVVEGGLREGALREALEDEAAA